MFSPLALNRNNRSYSFFPSPLAQLFNDEFFTPDSATVRPSVDIHEYKDKYLVHADLPGVEEKDIKVEFADGNLVIEGKRDFAKSNEAAGQSDVIINERTHTSFKRIFQLGDAIDPQSIEAAYKNGTLTVTIPKTEKALPKVIPIKVK